MLAVVRQETATNESLQLVGGGCGEEGRTGARRTRAGASEPPTSHNDLLVDGTREEGQGKGGRPGQGRKARAREDPPTSVINSLVAVGAGEDQGWGE